MANAIWVVHRHHGLWNTDGGYEFPLVLIATAATLAFTGTGRFSLDHLFGWNLTGIGWGVTALALGALGWLVGIAARYRTSGHVEHHTIGQTA